MTTTVAEAIIPFQKAPTRTRRQPAAVAQPLLPTVVIGALVGFDNGQPLVAFAGHTLPALTGVELTLADIGRQVTLAFADGAADKPVILNRLLEPAPASDAQAPVEVRLDGEKLLLTANKTIELRCGDASITLTAAGKVLLKGTYVLSRSSGYNKIKGAVVDIN